MLCGLSPARTGVASSIRSGLFWTLCNDREALTPGGWQLRICSVGSNPVRWWGPSSPAPVRVPRIACSLLPMPGWAARWTSAVHRASMPARRSARGREFRSSHCRDMAAPTSLGSIGRLARDCWASARATDPLQRRAASLRHVPRFRLAHLGSSPWDCDGGSGHRGPWGSLSTTCRQRYN